MSFQNRAELSLLPSKVRRHPEHLVKGSSLSDFSVLKVGIIYGANASGKSNLIKAMRFAQRLVNDGVKAGKTLPYTPFALDSEAGRKPSRFEFEFKIGTSNYAYGFIADAHRVHEEWLSKIEKHRDVAVFSRNDTDGFIFPKILFESEKDKLFFEFTTKGTPENRLFLNEFRERKVLSELPYLTDIKNASEWFDSHLTIIFPNTKYHGLDIFGGEDSAVATQLSEILNSFDTGISCLALQEVDFDKGVDIPDDIKRNIVENLEEKSSVLLAGPKNSRYQLSRSTDGEIKAYKLMTKHKKTDGTDALFDIHQESDGTQRLLDLAPGLLDIFTKEKTFIVDELERSLHPDITISILKTFLASTQGKRSQLIVTTHESNLLDQDLVRKDEVWFVQKNTLGQSQLYSLEEFQPRFDNDIRRGYLAGRFGGVPVLPKFKNLSWIKQ